MYCSIATKHCRTFNIWTLIVSRVLATCFVTTVTRTLAVEYLENHNDGKVNLLFKYFCINPI